MKTHPISSIEVVLTVALLFAGGAKVLADITITSPTGNHFYRLQKP